MFDYLALGQGNSILFLLLAAFVFWSVAELAGAHERKISGGSRSWKHEETGSTTNHEENI